MRGGVKVEVLEKKLIEKLQGNIGEKRLSHSLGVRDMAEKLARRCGVEPVKARLAGLLHDCARDMSRDELFREARQAGLSIGEEEKQFPVLLHGPVGAVICRREFGVDDPEILRAIALHTTGSRGMTILDKVIYVADKVEPGRRYKAAESLRKAALADLDAGMKACLANSIAYLVGAGDMIHPETVKAWNDFVFCKS